VRRTKTKYVRYVTNQALCAVSAIFVVYSYICLVLVTTLLTMIVTISNTITGLSITSFCSKAQSSVYCRQCSKQKGLSDAFVKISFYNEMRVLEFARQIGYLSVHSSFTDLQPVSSLYHLLTYYPKVQKPICASDKHYNLGSGEFWYNVLQWV